MIQNKKIKIIMSLEQYFLKKMIFELILREWRETERQRTRGKVG